VLNLAKFGKRRHRSALVDILSYHAMDIIFSSIEPEVAPFDPPILKKTALEPNMKRIGWPGAEIWLFEIRHINT